MRTSTCICMWYTIKPVRSAPPLTRRHYTAFLLSSGPNGSRHTWYKHTQAETKQTNDYAHWWNESMSEWIQWWGTIIWNDQSATYWRCIVSHYNYNVKNGHLRSSFVLWPYVESSRLSKVFPGVKLLSQPLKKKKCIKHVKLISNLRLITSFVTVWKLHHHTLCFTTCSVGEAENCQKKNIYRRFLTKCNPTVLKSWPFICVLWLYTTAIQIPCQHVNVLDVQRPSFSFFHISTSTA